MVNKERTLQIYLARLAELSLHGLHKIDNNDHVLSLATKRAHDQNNERSGYEEPVTTTNRIMNTSSELNLSMYERTVYSSVYLPFTMCNPHEQTFYSLQSIKYATG